MKLLCDGLGQAKIDSSRDYVETLCHVLIVAVGVGLVKREPSFDVEVVAGDGGDGEMGRVGLELRVGFEEGGGGEGHFLLLFGGDTDERGAFVKVRAAVFDFGEVDLMVFGGDEVDFVGFGAEVLGD